MRIFCSERETLGDGNGVETKAVGRTEMMLTERWETTDDPPVDEGGLVAAAQRDRRAFAPLYARYSLPIYRYCYRRLGNHEAAEDATSQTFVKALDALGRFRGNTFRAWLFTIADRVVIDLYRRQRPQFGIDEADSMTSVRAGPEEMSLAAESRLSLQEALTQLTPDQQQVIALRLAGLTGREVAIVMNRGHEAVKGLQFRAYARLRKLLDDGAPT
jgi:RNA polymerase sigma-70 factor, ECF subfamily